MTIPAVPRSPDDRPQRRDQRAPLIVQRDDGMFEIGTGIDPAGPFPSRAFAESVAARLP